MEIELTDGNFDQVIVNGGKRTVIDFWATWCGPCRMLAPNLANVAKKYSDKITVAKVNVDEQQNLAVKFNIEVIPTLVVIENGEEVKRTSGYMTESEIVEFLGL